MKQRKTSRILNDQSYFLGLSYHDITGLGVLLLGLILIFKALGIENMIWALVISASSLILVIPIRLQYRRRIIRDFVLYQFKKGVSRV